MNHSNRQDTNNNCNIAVRNFLSVLFIKVRKRKEDVGSLTSQYPSAANLRHFLLRSAEGAGSAVAAGGAVSVAPMQKKDCMRRTAVTTTEKDLMRTVDV